MLKKKKRTLLVLIHDGVNWHGGLRLSGKWESRLEKGSAEELPEHLLTWGEQQGARRVRAAVPSELTDLGAPDPQLAILSAPDAFQALAYDFAEKSGGEAERLCPAAARLPFPEQDGRRELLAVAAFERNYVSLFVSGCRLRGMAFEGFSPLHGLLLAEASESAPPFKTLHLYADGRGLFLCGLSAETHTPQWRKLPSPLSSAGQGSDAERRLQRTLTSFTYESLSLTAEAASLALLAERFRTLVPGILLQTAPLTQRLSAWMERLEQASLESAEGSLGLVGLPPKPQDARATGGILCYSILLLTTLALVLQWRVLRWQHTHYTELKQKLALLEAAKTSSAAALERAQRELSEIRALCSELENTPPKINGHFLPLLHALACSTTPYSHLLELTQEQGKTRVVGITFWQQDLTAFTEKLQLSLKPAGLRVVPGAVEGSTAADQRRFSFSIEPVREP